MWQALWQVDSRNLSSLKRRSPFPKPVTISPLYDFPSLLILSSRIVVVIWQVVGFPSLLISGLIIMIIIWQVLGFPHLLISGLIIMIIIWQVVGFPSLLISGLIIVVIIWQVLTVAVEKGQLSQSVQSRLASCRILGKVATRCDSFMWVSRGDKQMKSMWHTETESVRMM